MFCRLKFVPVYTTLFFWTPGKVTDFQNVQQSGRVGSAGRRVYDLWVESGHKSKI